MTDPATQTHSPWPPRLITGVPALVLGGVVALVAAPAIGGLPGLVVAVVGVVAGVGGAALCWGTTLVIDGDALMVRNPFRTRRLRASDVDEIRPERLAGFVGPKGSVAGVVASGGSVTRVLASLSPGGHGRAELFLELRRWSARHRVTDRLERQEYGDAGTRLDLLEAGDEVEVTGQLRRTDSRGWGSWDEVRVRLPSTAATPPDGDDRRRPVAKWMLVNPPDTALEGPPRPRPLDLRGGVKSVLRDVRFPEEAFFGSATRFVVVTTMQRTVELALPEEEAEPVLVRLRALAEDRPPAEPPGEQAATGPEPAPPETESGAGPESGEEGEDRSPESDDAGSAAGVDPEAESEPAGVPAIEDAGRAPPAEPETKSASPPPDEAETQPPLVPPTEEPIDVEPAEEATGAEPVPADSAARSDP